MSWLYLGIAIFAVVGAIMATRLLADKPTLVHVGAWLSMGLGTALVFYAQLVDPDIFVLMFGVTCIVTGAVIVESARLQERIRQLEHEVQALRGQHKKQADLSVIGKWLPSFLTRLFQRRKPCE